jgi:DNA-binding PadR family transcriptional regulator
MSSIDRNTQPDVPKDRARTTGGRSPNSAYELFVLGELVGGPHYGYRLHRIIQRILGPFHRLSWGTLYPLIRRLEQQGLITSEIEPRDTTQEEGGQSRKIYRLTSDGRGRFFALMLDPGEYSPDYPDLFAVKLSKFALLTPAQRLVVLQQYREYLSVLREYYSSGARSVIANPGITEQERPFILQLSDYHVHSFDAKLAWLDDRIAALTEPQD